MASLAESGFARVCFDGAPLPSASLANVSTYGDKRVRGLTEPERAACLMIDGRHPIEGSFQVQHPSSTAREAGTLQCELSVTTRPDRPPGWEQWNGETVWIQKDFRTESTDADEQEGTSNQDAMPISARCIRLESAAVNTSTRVQAMLPILPTYRSRRADLGSDCKRVPASIDWNSSAHEFRPRGPYPAGMRTNRQSWASPHEAPAGPADITAAVHRTVMRGKWPGMSR